MFKRKILKISMLVCLFVIPNISSIGVASKTEISENNVIKKTLTNVLKIKTKTEWDYFLEALILTESGGDSTIYGKTEKGYANSVGVLQITPIYVKAVNKISEKKFTLEDRKSKVKSLEMFEIMNKKYNPEKNINRALYLHNSRAPKSYKEKVFLKMKKLKNQ